jgi:hypothetical protein
MCSTNQPIRGRKIVIVFGGIYTLVTRGGLFGAKGRRRMGEPGDYVVNVVIREMD